ncbi:hypothetical protein [Psychroserpens sp. SPM9]|uniref:hypothetical protein n=1 Tax=Psychroserpens sp. SPM9 TaxID=2975598 RepID=UPI0021A4DA48|nr:hypothetical protein [Psychroserpens sp. SPM9]MDG5492045.1 hypothetical protein [Psychroserpens sp. SPM9]
MKSETTLRILLTVSLGISIIQFLNYTVQLGTSIFDVIENPLIPQGIWKLAAFPLSLMAVLYLVLTVINYLNFKRKSYNLVRVLVLFVMTLLITILAGDIYLFVNSFNPYES